MNNVFIFYLCVTTFYTCYRGIKRLENKYETDNDWVHAKFLNLEKEIKNNRELIISLQNHIDNLNQKINKFNNIYQDNLYIETFLPNNLRIINPSIFCDNKTCYFHEICKSPYFLENATSTNSTNSTSSTSSTNIKYVSPIDDWTQVINEYNV